MTPAERIRAIAVVVAVALFATTLPAHAQSAEAEVLFREGRKLHKQGKIAAACEKFAASERVESSVGTLLNLGDCREKLGQLATAWATFRKAEAAARRAGDDAQRAAEAHRRAAELESMLSHLTILVPPESRIQGLTIHRGEVVIDAAIWGDPVPVDPGSYTISAEAPGYVGWETQVEIAEREDRDTITVPRLKKPESEPESESESEPQTETEPGVVVGRVERREPSAFTSTRKVAIGIGVVGLGAVGGGVAFGIRARRFEEAANQECPGMVCNDPAALAVNQEARDSALRANVLFIAGGVAVASAVVMWLVGGPDDVTVTPIAGDGDVGVSFGGRF